MSAIHTMRNVQKPLAIFLLCLSAGTLSPLSNALAQNKITGKISTPHATSSVNTIDSIVAVVNDEVITRLELIGRMRTAELRMRNQKIAMPSPADLQRQILESMIVERAQMQLAKEFGIRVDDAMLDRAVARIAEQNKMTLQEFRNQLEKEGTPFAQFREEMRDQIIMQRLREREVDNKIQISDSEVDNFMLSESASASTQQEFNLAQILIRIPENASPEQIASRRARAEDVMRQLRSGADFAKTAASFSDAPEALKGGEIGWRNPDRLPQLFNDAIANLREGGVSALVKSANGFHILKVIGKRSPAPVKAGGAVVQQTHARHILIKVNQVVSSYDAKRKLVELKERLDNKAAKFEELARLFSNDGSASKGGDLGWIYPGDTVPDFERAMDALKPGQVSEPIESPFGFHLIEVIERKSDDVSKERQRKAARQTLYERKADEATEEWLRQIRDRAYVEYRLEDR